jgi:hypothetical protein
MVMTSHSDQRSGNDAIRLEMNLLAGYPGNMLLAEAVETIGWIASDELAMYAQERETEEAEE